MESWPAWATEPVQLQEADRDWAVRGDEECSVLEVLLAPWLTSRIEHIGSTAVPGLPAKATSSRPTSTNDRGGACSSGSRRGGAEPICT